MTLYGFGWYFRVFGVVSIGEAWVIGTRNFGWVVFVGGNFGDFFCSMGRFGWRLTGGQGFLWGFTRWQLGTIMAKLITRFDGTTYRASSVLQGERFIIVRGGGGVAKVIAYVIWDFMDRATNWHAIASCHGDQAIFPIGFFYAMSAMDH